MNYWKCIKIFGIKSALVLKNNLIAKLSAITFFLKTKAKSCGNKATDIHHKEKPKVGSNHTFLAVVTIDFVF